MSDLLTSMNVRTANPSDCAAIAALHAWSWQVTYKDILASDYLALQVVDDRRDLWEARFSSFDQQQHLVAVAIDDRDEADPKLVGFVCVLLDEEPEYGALLDNLHVAPDRHRGGIGRRLMASAAHWCAALQPGRPMHLWVYEDNRRTVAFYESTGGNVVDRRMILTPAANRATVLRFEWQDTTLLARTLDESLARSTA